MLGEAGRAVETPHSRAGGDLLAVEPVAGPGDSSRRCGVAGDTRPGFHGLCNRLGGRDGCKNYLFPLLFQMETLLNYEISVGKADKIVFFCNECFYVFIFKCFFFFAWVHNPCLFCLLNIPPFSKDSLHVVGPRNY